MNKSILLRFLLIIGVNALYSQDSKTLELNIENLSKKWEVVDLINPDRTTEELKEMLSMLEGTSLLFNEDLTYAFNFIVDLEGTWELKNNVIHTKDERGKTQWVIHHLQEKTLILSRNQATQKLVFKSI